MKKLIVLIMVFALSASGCRATQGNTLIDTANHETITTESTESEEERAARLEKERLAAEEAARKKAEEEAAKKAAAEAERKAKTFYVVKQSTVYSDEALTVPTETILTYKTAVLTGDVIKDEAGEISAYSIVAIDDKEDTGYIKASELHANLADFIAMPYEGVDYSAFEKHQLTDKPPVLVKGLFITQNTARSSKRIDQFIEIANTTEINALVIDVKDDSGHLLFKVPGAETVVSGINDNVAINDIKAFVKKLKDNDIYLIARIVSFKSPNYAKQYPERAITYPNGTLFTKGDGLEWGTGYDRQLWDYLMTICKAAADVGFDEIQFDYVRFPVASGKIQLNYHNDLAESKALVIHNFLKYAYEQLADSNVYITADVFGWAGSALNDTGIGQHWEAIANVVDYTAPMMYPSHYGKGNFGLTYPDTLPYQTIDASIKDIIERNSNLETPAKVRPWIQDFTASWLKPAAAYIPYGSHELRQQIKALKDNGVEEYMVWNSGNNYHLDAFEKETGEDDGQ